MIPPRSREEESTGSPKYRVRTPVSRSKSNVSRLGLTTSSFKKFTISADGPSKISELGLPDTSDIVPGSAVM